MTEIFVIERTPTGLQPAIYDDELPVKYQGKRASLNGLGRIFRGTCSCSSAYGATTAASCPIRSSSRS